MKPEFILTDRRGKQSVLYAGLLDACHEQGLKSVVTTLVQIPSEANKNVAIVKATVETAKGTFDGLGDASPANAGNVAGNALIRFAETRAKSRAMRDAVNIGMLLEGDEDAEPESDAAKPRERDRDDAWNELIKTPGWPIPENDFAGARRFITDTLKRTVKMTMEDFDDCRLALTATIAG